MATRGFLKTVGASKRMRIVLPPYDANDFNIPANAVVFDTENLAGVTGIYEQGTVSFQVPCALTKVAAWADPGYIPMTFVFTGLSLQQGGTVPASPPSPDIIDFGPAWDTNYDARVAATKPRMQARRDGLYVSIGWNNNDLRGWVLMQYTALNIPV